MARKIPPLPPGLKPAFSLSGQPPAPKTRPAAEPRPRAAADDPHARLPFEIGDRIIIETCGEAAERIVSRVVGGRKTGYVIVEHRPETEGLPERARECPLRAHVVRDGKIYSFDIRSVTLVEEPYPLLFLEFSNPAQVLDLRSSKRLGAVLPTELVAGKKIYQGLIVDLSPDGCRFKLKRALRGGRVDLAVDDEVRLFFHIFEKDNSYNTLARVVRMDDDGTDIFYGLKFLSSEFDTVLSDYLNDIYNLY